MPRIDEKARQETVELLQRLIQIPSTNPPGNESRIAAFIKAVLSQNGIKATVVPLEEDRCSLVARLPGKEPGSIILCGHMDTVDAREGQWNVPPFAGRIDGGRVWGRGSADMKGGVTVLLELARLIVREKFTPRKSVILVFTADEEGAYRGAASVAQSGLIDDAEFLVVTEPTAGEVFIGQKGELWVEVTFLGKAAHGSVPQLGINTILPASEFCLALARAAEEFEEIPGRGRTTVNVGQIDGGWQVNVVPDTTKVRLDIRIVSEKAKFQVLNLVEKLGAEAASRTGATFSFTIMSDHPPIASDPRHSYVRAFLTVATGSPELSQQTEFVPYYTDAGVIVPAFDIPVVVYGPGSIAQAHQPDEYLTLDSLYETLDVLARFLTFDGRGKSGQVNGNVDGSN